MPVDRILSFVLACADAGARALVIVGAAVMTAVVAAQVVMRYVFNGSFDWADEISRLAFVSTIFLAIPLGIRDGTHVRIDLLVERLPARFRLLVLRSTSALAAALMLVVFVTSIDVAKATWTERLGAIDFTSSVYFFALIAGALHSALHFFHIALFPDGRRP